MEEELIYLNALNRISFLGPARIVALLKHFGSPREAWCASRSELGEIPELKGYEERLLDERRWIDPQGEWQRLQEAADQLSLVTFVQLPSFAEADPPATAATLLPWNLAEK